MLSEQEFTSHIAEFARIVRAPTKSIRPRYHGLEELNKSLSESMDNPALYNVFDRSMKSKNYLYAVHAIACEVKGQMAIAEISEGSVIRPEIMDMIAQSTPDVLSRLQTLTREYEAYEAEQTTLGVAWVEKNRQERIERENEDRKHVLASIEDLSPETVAGLYTVYVTDPGSVIERLMYNFFPCFATYAPYPNSNKSFLNGLGTSETVRKAILVLMREAFNQCGDGPVDGIKELRPTLPEMVEIAHYALYPPFPLMPSFHEDEYRDDHRQVAAFAAKANVQHVVNMNTRLYESVLNGTGTGNVRIMFKTPNGLVGYDLHDHVLEEYPELATVRFVQFNDTASVRAFIRGLYTGDTGLDITPSVMEDVRAASAQLKIVGLEFMAKELLEDTVSPPGFARHAYVDDKDDTNEDEDDSHKENEDQDDTNDDHEDEGVTNKDDA